MIEKLDGTLMHIGRNAARNLLDRGAAELLRPGVIKRKAPPTRAASFDHSQAPKPAWGANLTSLLGGVIPAAEHDSNLGQTFVRYPQSNQSSYGPKYSGIANYGRLDRQ